MTLIEAISSVDVAIELCVKNYESFLLSMVHGKGSGSEVTNCPIRLGLGPPTIIHRFQDFDRTHSFPFITMHEGRQSYPQRLKADTTSHSRSYELRICNTNARDNLPSNVILSSSPLSDDLYRPYG